MSVQARDEELDWRTLIRNEETLLSTWTTGVVEHIILTRCGSHVNNATFVPVQTKSQEDKKINEKDFVTPPSDLINRKKCLENIKFEKVSTKRDKHLFEIENSISPCADLFGLNLPEVRVLNKLSDLLSTFFEFKEQKNGKDGNKKGYKWRLDVSVFLRTSQQDKTSQNNQVIQRALLLEQWTFDCFRSKLMRYDDLQRIVFNAFEDVNSKRFVHTKVEQPHTHYCVPIERSLINLHKTLSLHFRNMLASSMLHGAQRVVPILQAIKLDDLTPCRCMCEWLSSCKNCIQKYIENKTTGIDTYEQLGAHGKKIRAKYEGQNKQSQRRNRLLGFERSLGDIEQENDIQTSQFNCPDRLFKETDFSPFTRCDSEQKLLQHGSSSPISQVQKHPMKTYSTCGIGYLPKPHMTLPFTTVNISLVCEEPFLSIPLFAFASSECIETTQMEAQNILLHKGNLDDFREKYAVHMKSCKLGFSTYSHKGINTAIKSFLSINSQSNIQNEIKEHNTEMPNSPRQHKDCEDSNEQFFFQAYLWRAFAGASANGQMPGYSKNVSSHILSARQSPRKHYEKEEEGFTSGRCNETKQLRETKNSGDENNASTATSEAFLELFTPTLRNKLVDVWGGRQVSLNSSNTELKCRDLRSKALEQLHTLSFADPLRVAFFDWLRTNIYMLRCCCDEDYSCNHEDSHGCASRRLGMARRLAEQCVLRVRELQEMKKKKKNWDFFKLQCTSNILTPNNKSNSRSGNVTSEQDLSIIPRLRRSLSSPCKLTLSSFYCKDEPHEHTIPILRRKNLDEVSESTFDLGTPYIGSHSPCAYSPLVLSPIPCYSPRPLNLHEGSARRVLQHDETSKKSKRAVQSDFVLSHSDQRKNWRNLVMPSPGPLVSCHCYPFYALLR